MAERSHVRSLFTRRSTCTRPPEAVVVKAAIPGTAPEDLGITIAGQTLSMRGSCGYRLSADESREATWHTAEIVTLPEAVDPEQARVGHEQGILTLTMAKTKETRATRTPVRRAAPAAS